MSVVTETLQELDYRHLWHPYTDINVYENAPFTCFDSAEGVYLYTTDGRRVLDGIASWWCVALGHSHARIVAAIREQAGILQQSILGNQAHPLAIRLAARLAGLAPGDLNRVYFAGDGASATEAALKIAVQYWWNIGRPKKTRFVSLAEGYHGDTLGAVGVGFVPSFHAPFEKAVVKALIAGAPFAPCNSGDAREMEAAEAAFAGMRRIVEQHHEEIAGVILEPLVQGAAGVRIYPAEYLKWVRDLCDEFDLLLIADEIAVGFGRTGSLFACDYARVVPDMLCLGKAMTGGYLPMSATIVTDRVYDAFRSDETNDRTFYDGHTFCGNPITSAAALAFIEALVEDGNVLDNVADRAIELRDGFTEIGRHGDVAYSKSVGLIGMCAIAESAGGASRAKRIARAALDSGLFIRPLGNALYLWPPLTTTHSELACMLRHFQQALYNASSRDVQDRGSNQRHGRG